MGSREQVTSFVAKVVAAGSAARACNVRVLLVQVKDEGVKLGLAEDNAATKVRPPWVPKVTRLTLSPIDVRRLLDATDERFAAAVALCYVQGWRVSEALGLAWQDLDFDGATVHVRRGSTYADRIGMVLGPTKTARTAGRQLLGPTVVELWRTPRVCSSLKMWPASSATRMSARPRVTCRPKVNARRSSARRLWTARSFRPLTQPIRVHADWATGRFPISQPADSRIGRAARLAITLWKPPLEGGDGLPRRCRRQQVQHGRDGLPIGQRAAVVRGDEGPLEG